MLTARTLTRTCSCTLCVRHFPGCYDNRNEGRARLRGLSAWVPVGHYLGPRWATLVRTQPHPSKLVRVLGRLRDMAFKTLCRERMFTHREGF